MTEETTNIYMALAEAQNTIGRVFKNSQNPHFRSNYLDLAGLIDAVQPALFEHKLVLFQTVAPANAEFEEPTLITRLVHTPSKEEIVSVYPLRAKDLTDPQKLGATVTYARRYAMMAVLGLAPEDDDGNAAAGHSDRGGSATTGSASGGKTFAASDRKPASDKQKGLISKLLKEAGFVTVTAQAKKIKELTRKGVEDLTSADASTIIEALKNGDGGAGNDSDDPPF